jgi:hypothetical protein
MSHWGKFLDCVALALARIGVYKLEFFKPQIGFFKPAKARLHYAADSVKVTQTHYTQTHIHTHTMGRICQQRRPAEAIQSTSLRA